MTVCIAALCDNRESMILVADKMVGMGFVEAETNIEKTLALHPSWRVMLAGDDISPVFDIVDDAKRTLGTDPVSVETVIEAVTTSFQKKRLAEAEAMFLATHGWSLERFVAEGRTVLGDTIFNDWDHDLSTHRLKTTLLVAGFDDQKKGHVFSVLNPGVSKRNDIPGFYSIGSGQFGALFMMFYREMGPKVSLEQAIYYAFEAKIFAENASGVGVDTDLYILKNDGRFTVIGEKSEELLTKLWQQLKPRQFKPKHAAMIKELEEVKSLRVSN